MIITVFCIRCPFVEIELAKEVVIDARFWRDGVPTLNQPLCSIEAHL